MRLVRVGSSLGGARPKAHLRDLNGRLCIAKFPSAGTDTWNVMAWEKVALDLAAAAGIAVPVSRLLVLADRHVLLVERFDRTPSEQRLGYVSAMTMLEAADGDQRSYLEIADVIERCSDRVTEDLHQLWRRIVFSILISNTDDHLRNHGFIHVVGDVWRLAPAFDLNPEPAAGPKYLATSIDGTDDAADLDIALGVAEYFRLDGDTARVVVGQVAGAVSGWRQAAARSGLSGKEIDRMSPAFTVPHVHG
jgi:serine/threonine-protein kinase HipA